MLPQRFELLLVLCLVRRVGPQRRVGLARLERIVGIEQVEEDEERDVAVRAEPLAEPVDILARGLARGAHIGGARLVELLEPLVQIAELSGKQH